MPSDYDARLAQQTAKIREYAPVVGLDADAIIRRAFRLNDLTGVKLSKCLEDVWDSELRSAIVKGDMTLMDRLPADAMPWWHGTYEAAWERFHDACRELGRAITKAFKEAGRRRG